MEKILRCYNKQISKEKALDIFLDSVENYKKAPKKDKLKHIAESYINALMVMKIDFLTGAQAFEVANNLATDFETNKDIIEKEIIKLIIKERRKKHEKTFIYRFYSIFVRLCKRKARISLRGTKRN